MALNFKLSSGNKVILGRGNKDYSLATFMNNKLKEFDKISIVSGFLTKEGFHGLTDGRNPSKFKEFGEKLDVLILGRFTKNAAEVYNQHFDDPLYKDKLYVHLGLGKEKERHEIIKKYIQGILLKEELEDYRRMVHSKIYALYSKDFKRNLVYIVLQTLLNMPSRT